MKNIFAALVACLLTFVIVPFATADSVKIKFDPVYSVGNDLTLTTVTSKPTVETPSKVDFSSDLFYDCRRKKTSAVVSTPVGHLTNLFGCKDWSLDTSTFMGADNGGSALAGIAATKSFKVADQLSFFGGVGLVFADGEKPYGGLRFGFAFSQ